MYWIDPTDLELPPDDPNAEIADLVATAGALEDDDEPWIRPPRCWTPEADARARAVLAAWKQPQDLSRLDFRLPAPAAAAPAMFDDDPLLSWSESD